MTITAKDLFIDQLQELLHADRLSRNATQVLVEHASDSDLTTALENGVCGIGDGIDVVEKVLGNLGASTEGRANAGMDGLVADSARGVLEREFADDETRDDAIIMHFQRFTHFGLASYAALVAAARRAGLADAADELQTCLSNARDGEDEMQKILTARG